MAKEKKPTDIITRSYSIRRDIYEKAMAKAEKERSTGKDVNVSRKAAGGVIDYAYSK